MSLECDKIATCQLNVIRLPLDTSHFGIVPHCFLIAILNYTVAAEAIAMESSTKLELIDQAIQKLLAEKRNKEASGDLLFHDDNDQILLSRLLSDVYISLGESNLGLGVCVCVCDDLMKLCSCVWF